MNDTTAQQIAAEFELEFMYTDMTLYLDGPSAPRVWAEHVMTRDCGAFIKMSNPTKHGLRRASWDLCFQDEVEDALVYAIADAPNKLIAKSLSAMLARVMKNAGN
jgi:hypothetical protein